MHFTKGDNDTRTNNVNNNPSSLNIRSIYFITCDNNDNIITCLFLFVVN